MFKKADKIFEELGYVKNEEDCSEFFAAYEKEEKFGIRRIDIYYKNKGKGGHTIASYEKKINEDGFNNCCGMNAREAKACLRKMREMKLINIFGKDINRKG